MTALTSEDQLHRKLKVAWSTTTHERVADADVWRDGDRQKPCPSPSHRIDRRCHVSREAREQRIRKVWVIEDVEDFSSQLQPQFLSQLSVLEDRKIDVVITRTTQGVAAKRTEVPGAGNTGSRTAVAAGIECAGHFECGQVDEAVRRARSGIRIADEIGSREKLTGVVVVVKQRQVKRITATHRYDRIQLPTFTDARMRLPQVRQLVTRGGDEPMSTIEIRVCLLASRAVAVVGLRRIRHLVLTVRRVVD